MCLLFCKIKIDSTHYLKSLFYIGTSTFLMYSLNWEIHGLSLDENMANVPVLAPVSRIAMASILDFVDG